MKTILNILLALMGQGLWMKSSAVFAQDKIAQEVFLKKINQRFSEVLKESTEARVFLDEDLRSASEFLALAKIKWLPTYQEGAQLLLIERGMVGLSQHYSFMTSPIAQVEILMEFLFQLKRQLEGSTLFIPQARIKLFAQRYAPMLLSEDDPCSLSLFPFAFEISDEVRADFTYNALKKIARKNYSYQSTWSRRVMVVEKIKSNKVTLRASLLDWRNLSAQVIAESSALSRGDEREALANALRKLSKRINNHLPACNHQTAI